MIPFMLIYLLCFIWLDSKRIKHNRNKLVDSLKETLKPPDSEIYESIGAENNTTRIDADSANNSKLSIKNIKLYITI